MRTYIFQAYITQTYVGPTRMKFNKLSQKETIRINIKEKESGTNKHIEIRKAIPISKNKCSPFLENTKYRPNNADITTRGNSISIP